MIQKEVLIQASLQDVWGTLTQPERMQLWIGDPEMKIIIETNWEINSPIKISGYHHIHFENQGRVLEYEPYQKLAYSQLSSISRLPDHEQNYTLTKFNLQSTDDGVLLQLTLRNFPTNTILKHLDFYWRTTIILIKRCAENIHAKQDPIS